MHIKAARNAAQLQRLVFGGISNDVEICMELGRRQVGDRFGLIFDAEMTSFANSTSDSVLRGGRILISAFSFAVPIHGFN